MLHSEYVKAAQRAIAHVQSTVRYRGLNTGGGWIRHPFESNQKIVARIFNVVESRSRSAARTEGGLDRELYIDEMARAGELSNTGNCSELSAIAFRYLESREVFPIEYFTVMRGHWDHAFVVLNRDASIPVKDFASWSYQAVVCDPLYDRAADAGHLATWYPRMFPMQDQDMFWRIEP
ncbi:MAG: hypothetical protein JSR41_20830 [Proteobacteria bacterium]|nr:hypothetical protein [Pseudomonadota bacterium]